MQTTLGTLASSGLALAIGLGLGWALARRRVAEFRGQRDLRWWSAELASRQDLLGRALAELERRHEPPVAPVLAEHEAGLQQLSTEVASLSEAVREPGAEQRRAPAFGYLAMLRTGAVSAALLTLVAGMLYWTGGRGVGTDSGKASLATRRSVEHLLKMAGDHPDDLNALLEVGHELLLEDQGLAGATLIEHALALAPDNAEAAVHMAALAMLQGRLGEAAQSLDAAVSRSPEMLEAWYYRGVNALHHGGREVARKSFTQYLVRAATPGAAEQVRSIIAEQFGTFAPPNREEAMAMAEVVWRVRCAPCHADDGSGRGTRLPHAIVDLRKPAWQDHTTDERLHHVLQTKPVTGLSPAEVDDLIQYLRRLRSDAPGP